MRKILNFLKNKIALKYLFAILILIILVSTLYLLKSNSNQTQLRSKDNSSKIKRILEKADILMDTYKYDSCYYYYNKAQSLCNPETDYVDYVYALTCMANVEQYQGDYIASETSLLKTLPYLKKIKKPRFAANVYEQFAANYYYTFDCNNALLYYTKALHLKTSYYRKISVLNNISTVYIRQKKINLAISILIPLSKLTTICKTDKVLNDIEHARILSHIGSCYHAQGKLEALYYYKKSLAMQLKLKEYDGISYSYLHLAEYFQTRDLSLATTYAKKAYFYSDKINDPVIKLQSLKTLSKTTSGNDLKNYSTQFIQLADSITKASHKSKKQFARIKYYFKKYNTENLQLKAYKAESELEIERQKIYNIILPIIIALILIFVAFLYFHLKSKGRKEKNKAIFESELRISEKLRCELTNYVYHSLTFAETADLEKRENKEKLLNNLHTIYTKTRNISKENGFVPTNESFSTALKEMIAGFKTADLNIILNGFDQISWNELEKSKKIILYRILQELFANMKKHSQPTLVSLTFKNFEKKIVVLYSDNGVEAYNRSIILKKDLVNIENRILNIKGEIDILSITERGIKVEIKLPLR
ncbi:tetratricopeptide repeat-containing sensor histidine kinase [Flavobacterium collinsii]|uniref:Signal transduction histidine kinase subgroup 3 dimerisation and phosphoacceptor domain-containing protein n=1 Tax=Flavobacterium collinsii TaxID=1114861 RepID=A0A9W4XCI4_9FLAO|nr:tetratricopeptide repeat-containing sensor histidine kinase [Flavobacterium collinsii]CAI2765136.1 conserved protein of unknown function [Flavobacterium collinsii]